MLFTHKTTSIKVIVLLFSCTALMTCITAPGGHSSAEIPEELRKRSVMFTCPKSGLNVCDCVCMCAVCLKHEQALAWNDEVLSSLGCSVVRWLVCSAVMSSVTVSITGNVKAKQQRIEPFVDHIKISQACFASLGIIAIIFSFSASVCYSTQIFPGVEKRAPQLSVVEFYTCARVPSAWLLQSLSDN